MASKKSKTSKQDRTALETNQTAEIAWLANQWQEHPTVGLTPERLNRLLTDAEQGNLTAQADLFSDMEEKDTHIFSEMDKRKKGLNGLEWNVTPPKNATAQEKKMAEEVAEWMDDIKDFEMFLFDAMDGVGHGYSCQEIEWHQMGSLWLPKSFEHVNARNFMTPYSQPNELRLNDGSPDGADFWDFGWFIHRHKAKSGYIARSGLHRVLSWPFLFKNYGVRDIMEFLEIYGLPIRLGKYPSGATAEEKTTLLRAVMMIGRNAGGAIPQGMSIDFESAATGDTDNHMALIKWCEQSQSKAIVGGTLLSQADGKTSTNAQSKTHEVQFDKLVKSDAKQLSRSITDSLISHMMRINYPNITEDRYPAFAFDTSDIEDMETFSNSLDKLVKVGMKIPRSWAHEKLGIPEPADDDEPVLGVQAEQTTPNLAANNLLYAGLQNNLLAAMSQTTTSNPAEVAAIRGQMLLDDQIQQNIDNQHLQNQAEQILPQLLAKLSTADDIDGALAMLAEIFPERGLDGLQSDLEQLIFASDVLGRLSVDAGRNRG